MKLKPKIKNTILAGIAGLTLTACGGGGGGGGAVGTVNNFVQNDLASLSGTTQLITTANGLVSQYEDSSNNDHELSNILAQFMSAGAYTPTGDDISEAEKLKTTINSAINWWKDVEGAIATTTEYTDSNGRQKTFTDKDRMAFYQLESYKDAKKAMKYLESVALPIIEQVAKGETISDLQVTDITSESKYNEYMNSYDAEISEKIEVKKKELITFNTKEVTLTPVLKSNNDVPQTDKKEVVPSNPEEGWTYVNGAGGKQTREVTTTIPNLNVKVYEDCDEVRRIYKDGTYDVISSDCNDRTVSNAIASTVTKVTEERMGENYIVDGYPKDISDPPVDETLKQNVNQKTTTYVDVPDSESQEVVEGMATTTTEPRIVKTKVDNGDNTSTETWTEYTDTVVTTPITTITYKDREYTHKYTTDQKLKRTTIKKVKEVYADGTENTITYPPVIKYPNGY